MAEFIDALDAINAIADHCDGFRWRLQTEDGNATSVRPFEDETILINMSTWDSVESLADYVYRSAHTAFLRRRAEWFQRFRGISVALWWVPTGHRPSADEGIARLRHLEDNGPTHHAFDFRHRFAPDGEQSQAGDNRDTASPERREPARPDPARPTGPRWRGRGRRGWPRPGWTGIARAVTP